MIKYNKNYQFKRKILFLYFYLYFIFSFYVFNKLNVCVCTIGKLENLYAKEFILHYKRRGVDKVYIYDNNDIDGEKFESVLFGFIKKGFVEIINIRGKTKYQLKAYQDCLNKNYNKFDWLIFYDMDEFIYLKKYKNIKNYLSQQKFSKCQTIQLNMFFHDDNNLIYYDDRLLYERFKRKVKKPVEALKSILKGNISINIEDVHNLNSNLTSCNGFGEINKYEKTSIYTNRPDFTFNYIDHFCFKSTQEFTNKLMRGSAFYGKINEIKLKKIHWYFNINSITKKKIDYIENRTKLNLSIYRNKISLNTFML